MFVSFVQRQVEHRSQASIFLVRHRLGSVQEELHARVRAIFEASDLPTARILL